MSGKEVAVKKAVDPVQRAALNAKLAEMVAGVPGQEGDGMLNMIEQILSADRIEDLDRPWNSEGIEAYLDHALLVNSIKKMVSDIKDGPGFYLVITANDAETGEIITVTTSSIMVMVVLIHAHTMGWLPAVFIPRQAERPTENGYYPFHLEVYKGAAEDERRAKMRETTARLISERKAHQEADAATAGQDRHPAEHVTASAAAGSEPGY